jgi:hypothetical protein
MTAARPPIARRISPDAFIGSRQAIARYYARHPDQVKRHCNPIACDIATKTPLYDSTQAGPILTRLRRRAT